MQSGFHHHEKRQRIKKGFQLIDTRFARFIDVIIYPIGILGLVMTLPQVYEVWVLGHTEGLSLITWGTWSFISIFWVIYGMVHKTKALVFLHSCWFFMNGLVALGIFIKS